MYNNISKRLGSLKKQFYIVNTGLQNWLPVNSCRSILVLVLTYLNLAAIGCQIATIYKSRYYRYRMFLFAKCSPMASKLQMSEELRNALPDIDEMRKLITENNE